MNAITLRNKAWKQTTRIPEWVRGRDIDLDQYNTLPDVAGYCWISLLNYLHEKSKTISDFTFIEPSAGTGTFYNLLPKKKRIGIDVEPFRDDYIQHDFLTWEPPKCGKFVAVGNPPFGYRGWLALAFMNKVSEFCDYAGFILPMSFQSDGKGSPKHRVNGMKLVHSEKLPHDLFITPGGELLNINALWQIWEKGIMPPKPDLSVCDEFVDLFTVDLRKERLCGMKKIQDCNTFIQRTYFGDHPVIVRSFSEVRYGCGYGIIFKKKQKEIQNILKNTNWNEYSNLAAHNCRHISMYHIKKAILDSSCLYPRPVW